MESQVGQILSLVTFVRTDLWFSFALAYKSNQLNLQSVGL